MRLSYETGVATLIQFIIIALLNIVNTIYSIIVTCHHSGGNDCSTNALSSIIYYLLIVTWFGIIVGIGYAAQAKRSRRYAQALIAAEVAVFVVAGYNVKLGISYHNNVLGLFTSFIDFVLAFWVIGLAWRLMRAHGGRVVRRRRVR